MSRQDTLSAEEVRRRIEVLHGNVVAQRAGDDPPTGKEDAIQAAYLAGRLHGLSSALMAFHEDVTMQHDNDVNDAYRALSEQFQHVNEVAAVNPDRQRGGFE